jgi:hypothetical protein
MYQEKKPFVPFLCCLLLLLSSLAFLFSVLPAQAYYHIEDDDTFGLLDEMHPGGSRNGTHQLGLYPSLPEPGKGKVSWHFLPTSSLRIPLDVIDCNPPVMLGLTRRSTSLEISLQTLLYADIKLMALLEEYARIQEQARRLLGQARSNGANEKSSGSQGRSAAGLAGGSSLQSDVQDVQAKKRHESRRVLQARSQDVDEKALQVLLSGSMTSLRKEAKGESQRLQSLVDEIISRAQNIELNNPSQRAQSLDTRKKVNLRTPAQQTDLPWLLEKLLWLVQYILSHKVEAGLYVVSAGVLFGIAMSVRK